MSALKMSETFRIENSFQFAVQIPDDTVGCSGSRCSNCGKPSAYCHHICQECNTPFIGPFGFPQLPQWLAMGEMEKAVLIQEIFCHAPNRGRLVYLNVRAVPLTEGELKEVELLVEEEAELFFASHHILPRDLRRILTV